MGAAGGGGQGVPRYAEVAIVGAGAAGLAAAAALHRRGIEAVVLEREDAVGSSWRRRYEGVRLNTVRWMSGMPGMGIPRSAGAWPSRDDFVAYLERYAESNRLDIRSGVEVDRVDRTGERYRLEASAGELIARSVVVATGYDNTPVVPDWPGREGFAGELIHSSGYSDPAPFRGRHVLVVGVGNTGTEIASELVDGGAASVRVSMRNPPNILRRNVYGVPSTVIARLSERQPAAIVDRAGFLLQRLLWGDLERYGIPRAPYGVATELRVKGLGPVLDSGFIAALKTGRIRVVPAVEGFERRDVLLRGGERAQPDVVIAATGYRIGLERLVGHLGVLLPGGRPGVVDGRAHPAAPGLYFNGFWLPLGGQLPTMRRTTRRIARAIAREHGRGARGRAPARRRSRAPARCGDMTFESLRGRKYCLLVTFRRDGRAVATPVWFGLDGDRLYVRTGRNTGKVKRIRRDSRTQLAPCNVRGKPLGPPVEATARILDGPEEEHAERALASNYGLGRRLYNRFLAAGDVYIQLTPRVADTPGSESPTGRTLR